MRGYARTDTFFRAIPLILERIPKAHFLAVAMRGSAEALGWVRKLGIEQRVTLLPSLPPEEMAALFQMSAVSLSLTEHDGTPNTLLEAMICGCFPVCGDLDSIREWIEDGINGLLVSAKQPEAVAGAVVRSLGDETLRKTAADRNRRLIAERADWLTVMRSAESFYNSLIS